MFSLNLQPTLKLERVRGDRQPDELDDLDRGSIEFTAKVLFSRLPEDVQRRILAAITSDLRLNHGDVEFLSLR